MGLMQDHGMKNIPRVGHRFIQATLRESEEPGGSQARIEQGDPEGLMPEVAHLGSEHLKGCLRTVEAQEHRLLPCHPHTQFEGRHQLRCLRQAQTMFPGELGNLQATQGREPPVLLKETLAHCDRTFPPHSDPQEDGEQLRIAQGDRSFLCHFLPGPLLIRQVTNDHDFSKCRFCSLEQLFLILVRSRKTGPPGLLIPRLRGGINFDYSAAAFGSSAGSDSPAGSPSSSSSTLPPVPASSEFRP